MQVVTPAPRTKRKDSLVGVCAAIGEDFGFNPDFLRVAVTASLLWNPVAVLIAYASAGLFVLASRWAFPVAKPERPSAIVGQVADVARCDRTFDEMPLARAA